MTTRPWMPLYIADYLADTAHLGALQSGAYLHLIMHYWQHDGLPDNDAALIRIARLTPPEWKRERATLASFFHDGWHHKRIDGELAHASEVSSKRRASAEHGRSKRAAIAPANVSAIAPANAPANEAVHARGLSQPPSQEGSLRSPSDNPESLETFPSVAPSQASGAAQLQLVAEELPEIPGHLDRRPYPEAFEYLWSEYKPIASPNSTKADSHRAWAKLSAADREACWTGLVRYAVWVGEENARRSAAKRPAVEVKHLATFINRRGWEPFLEEVA